MQYVCNTGLLCKWRQIPIEKLCQRHRPVCRRKNAKYEKYWIPLAQIFTARLKRSLKIENICQTKYFLRGGHLKLGFIDKLVWHFEKLHKFQFNQQHGGRGGAFIGFLSWNSAINHNGEHLEKKKLSVLKKFHKNTHLEQNAKGRNYEKSYD